jgi:hypothetical protein
MARITQKVRICDECAKKQIDDEKPRFGGSIFNGWCTLHIENGSTRLEALESKKDFDFCSVNCMLTHFS